MMRSASLAAGSWLLRRRGDRVEADIGEENGMPRCAYPGEAKVRTCASLRPSCWRNVTNA